MHFDTYYIIIRMAKNNITIIILFQRSKRNKTIEYAIVPFDTALLTLIRVRPTNNIAAALFPTIVRTRKRTV